MSTVAERDYIAALRRDPCAYCGELGEALDHIHCRHAGGGNDWWNLTSACACCNTRKRNRSLLGFMGWMKHRPRLNAAVAEISHWNGMRDRVPFRVAQQRGEATEKHNRERPVLDAVKAAVDRAGCTCPVWDVVLEIEPYLVGTQAVYVRCWHPNEDCPAADADRFRVDIPLSPSPALGQR